MFIDSDHFGELEKVKMRGNGNLNAMEREKMGGRNWHIQQHNRGYRLIYGRKVKELVGGVELKKLE